MNFGSASGSLHSAQHSGNSPGAADRGRGPPPVLGPRVPARGLRATPLAAQIRWPQQTGLAVTAGGGNRNATGGGGSEACRPRPPRGARSLCRWGQHRRPRAGGGRAGKRKPWAREPERLCLSRKPALPVCCRHVRVPASGLGRTTAVGGGPRGTPGTPARRPALPRAGRSSLGTTAVPLFTFTKKRATVP